MATFSGTSWLGIALVPAALGLDLLLWGGDTDTRFGFDLPATVVVACTACAFASLLVRRTHAVAVYAVVWVHAVLFTLVVPSYQPVAGLLIALYQLARHQRNRVALFALASAVVPFGLSLWDTVTLNGGGRVAVLVGVLLWSVIVGGIWLAGRVALWAEKTASLREDKARVESALALSDQRVRLARDLHDVVANAVTLVVIQAGGARALPAGDARVTSLLASIESTGAEAMRELRAMLRVLTPSDDRPDGEQHAAAESTFASIPSLLARVRAVGITVELDQSLTSVLSAEVERVAYRCVQEGLTNVVKHSGPGTRCTVVVTEHADRLEVVVTDDGQGSPAAGEHLSSGLGLPGLRGRVEAAGGRLHAEPLTPSGFRLLVRLPLRPAGDRPPRSSQAVPA